MNRLGTPVRYAEIVQIFTLMLFKMSVLIFERLNVLNKYKR